MKKRILLVVSCPILLWVVYIFALTKPSNSREWAVGMEKLPVIDVHGQVVVLKGLRDYHYDDRGLVSADYLDLDFDSAKLDRVWFVFEPFAQFKAVAHTYFVFDFKDNIPLVISVEARRGENQKYSAFWGLFNQYELMYVWATEGDQTVRDRKSTRLNSSHIQKSRMPSSA